MINEGSNHIHCSHDHSHSHLQAINSIGLTKSLWIGIGLNLVFVAIEFFVGAYSKSMALVADASHNLTDVVTLCLVALAIYLNTKSANQFYTLGYKKVSLLIALFNTTAIVAAMIFLIYESFQRFNITYDINKSWVIVTAGIGVVINFASAMLLKTHVKNDVNVGSAYLHLLADAGISFGVILSSLVMIWTDFNRLDLIVAILIGFFILYQSAKLWIKSFHLVTGRIPERLSFEIVENFFKSNEQVDQVDRLRIFALSSDEIILTVRVKLKDGIENSNIHALLLDMKKNLKAKFEIEDATIEIDL